MTRRLKPVTDALLTLAVAALVPPTLVWLFLCVPLALSLLLAAQLGQDAQDRCRRNRNRRAA
jgi:hypothetical protein